MPFSDSELSDLVYDELQADSESEQEYVPTKSQTRKQAQVSQEYRLQKALKPPRATTYTSRALYGTNIHLCAFINLLIPCRGYTGLYNRSLPQLPTR